MNLFTYDTYQDVRKNLFYYSIPFLIAAGFFCYWRILPPAHQQAIWSLISYVSNSEGWKAFSGTGIGIVLFSVIAFLLTELFQVHDQLWDKFVRKWRYYYAIDFILPRLVQPFASHLNFRFREEAEKHVGEFQVDLYYPFVGDRDSKIPKNKLVRFYEVITLYWLTQINEIVVCMLGIAVTVYSIIEHICHHLSYLWFPHFHIAPFKLVPDLRLRAATLHDSNKAQWDQTSLFGNRARRRSKLRDS